MNTLGHRLAPDCRHRKIKFETSVLDAIVVGRRPVFGSHFLFSISLHVRMIFSPA